MSHAIQQAQQAIYEVSASERKAALEAVQDAARAMRLPRKLGDLLSKGKETPAAVRWAILFVLSEALESGVDERGHPWTVTWFLKIHGLSFGLFYRWLDQEPAMLAYYDEARKRQAHRFAESAIELSRRPILPGSEDPGKLAGDREVLDPKWAQAELTRRREEVATYKWYAGKLAPKLYGDRQIQEHDGGQTLSIRVVRDE